MRIRATLGRAAGMNGRAKHGEALQSEVGLVTAKFRFDTLQLAAGELHSGEGSWLENILEKI